MKIDVVPLPQMLTDEHVRDRVVVVFDVLRATTTIAAALAAGAEAIRVFDSLDAARSAAAAFAGDKLLCGELKCLPPPGFDLGNSPGTYLRDRVAGKMIFLSTTNGTRALRRSPTRERAPDRSAGERRGDRENAGDAQLRRHLALCWNRRRNGAGRLRRRGRRCIGVAGASFH